MPDPSLWQQRLAPLLRPLSMGYGLALGARRRAYGLGLLASTTPPAPCVSVGNIAAGGGGKTPLAQWLLQWAAAQGLKACLLTRGYAGEPPHLPLRVTPQTPWQHCGDEPLLLARSAPEALVLVDPNRSRATAKALEFLPPNGPDMFIMDDGMQHLRLRRHVNLVLLRPEDIRAQWGRVLPLGRWREPSSALASADAFLVKCPPHEFVALREDIQRHVGHLQRPVFNIWLEPKRLVALGDGRVLSRNAMSRYIFFSGVADNRQAAATAADFLGKAPLASLGYPDHHAYSQADLDEIEAAMQTQGAECALCTAKDAVKLAGIARNGFHMLETELGCGASLFADEPFSQWWQKRWTRLHAAFSS